MSAPFNDILRGDPMKLDTILEGDYGPLNEQELRAAMQNILSLYMSARRDVEVLQRKILNFERKSEL